VTSEQSEKKKKKTLGDEKVLVGGGNEGRIKETLKGISYFLRPASASRQHRSSRKLDNSMDLNIWCLLPEVSLRLETPVKEAGDPMLQTFDVNCDEWVYVFPEGRNKLFIFFEVFDEGFALFRNMVHGILNSHFTEFHKDNDHVTGLPASLFHVIRHDILGSGVHMLSNKINEAEENPTFDQETISLAIS
jgi:hypothetical protein